MADFWERAAMKFGPASTESAAQVLDCAAAQFQGRGHVLGPRLTIAIELQQSYEPAVFAKESREIEFKLVKLKLRFFFQQCLIGPRGLVLD
jgi:hypothetical protein